MHALQYIYQRFLSLAGDRHQERIFKDWLIHCHSTLDKSIRFEQLADADVQACTLQAQPPSTLLLQPCSVTRTRGHYSL